jgi:chromosome segregation protein
LESIHAEFRDEEYNIIALKEQMEKEAHALTMPEIETTVRELFAEHEAFLEELLLTTSLEQFRGVQKHAKHITERLAAFLDELTDDNSGTMEALRVEMKHKEQALERLMREREKLQKETNDLRVNIETGKTKMQFLHAQLTREQDDLSSIQSDLDEEKSAKDATRKNAQAEQYTRLVQEYEQEIVLRDKKLQSVRTQIDAFNQEEEEKKSALMGLQNEMRTIQRKLTALRQQQSTVEVNLARVETRQEDVRAEVSRDVAADMHGRIFSLEVTVMPNRAQLQEQIASLQRQLEAIGSVDAATVKEHEETKARFEFLTTQTQDLSNSMESLETIIDELDKTIHTQFQKNFKMINTGFQKYFTVLFGGGKATLDLLTETEAEPEGPTPTANEAAAAGLPPAEVVETLEEEKKRELIGKKKKKQKLISGIEVLASPPGKKITHVAALSGGEKSLIAIALLCAIIGHHPSPFIVLDEVEAALDEENSEKFSAIITQLSQQTQLIIITHNRVTMRMADILYGVTMGKDGRSHILSVELKEAEEMIEAA